MSWQLLGYNSLRYVIMAATCGALFWGSPWMQAAGGVVLALVVLVKYTMLLLLQETDRIVSGWANGYFISGSLALAGGILLQSPTLIVVGGAMHLLYWYACCLGYCGTLRFFFDEVVQEDDPISAAP